MEELRTICKTEVKMRVLPFNRSHDRVAVDDFGRDLFADLITTRPYVGTNGSNEVAYSETEFLDETHDCCFGYPRRRAAPACVDRCNSPSFTMRNQNRHAIGCLNTDHDTGKPSYRCVSLDCFARCQSVVNIHDDSGMHLLQFDNRPARAANSRYEPSTIYLHHGVRGVRRSQREIKAFGTASRESMDNARNSIERLRMNERDLILAFYL